MRMPLPSTTRRRRGLLPILALTLIALIVPVSALAKPGPTVELQFLNVSDFHGQLDPVGGVGGAAVISAYWQADRAANPNTLTFTAGDAVGASPPISAFFDDIPTIQAMNLMGFNADTFGNHNFDAGIARLQSQINLANFTYVSANLQNRDDNLTGVKDFEIFTVGGVKVAIVGVTNPEAPTLVFPGNFGTIVPTDPVIAANKARAAAKMAGAQVMVAITHMGITGFDPATGAAFGPLIDFANNVGGFDFIFGDHTDFQYSGVHGKALVSENRSKGLTYSKTTFTVDSKNGQIKNKAVTFVTPTASAVTPDPAIVALLEPYRAALAPILNVVLGSADKAIPRADSCGRADGRLCESLVGNVVTDSMRLRYGTDFAITNAGGLRANLTCPVVDNPSDFCAASLYPFAAGSLPITRGQTLTVLPFGNIVVTLTVDGAVLKAFLETGVSAMPGANGRFPQVSGLCFTYDIAAPAGSRVTGAVRQGVTGACDGAAIDLTAASSYTLATNDFTASGGDGYPNVIGISVSREIMEEVLAGYIGSSSPITPTIQGRIVCTTSGATACPVTLP